MSAKRKPSDLEQIIGYCALIQVVIERVEDRCMAVDGPVTPTHKEIRDSELRRIYYAAQHAIRIGVRAMAKAERTK